LTYTSSSYEPFWFRLDGRSFLRSFGFWLDRITHSSPVLIRRLRTSSSRLPHLRVRVPSLRSRTHYNRLLRRRGDFEDRNGSSIPPNGVDIGIPEININLRSVPIVPKTRKLKAVWTPELSQDLNAYHSIDAEAELTAMLSEYISLEIDLEILEMLWNAAQTTNYWSAKIGEVWNGTAFVNDTNISGQAWTTMTWYQTLGNIMQKTSTRFIS
jgi:hypothetical protein